MMDDSRNGVVGTSLCARPMAGGPREVPYLSFTTWNTAAGCGSHDPCVRHQTAIVCGTLPTLAAVDSTCNDLSSYSVWTTCALPTRTRVPILNHSRLALRRCDETSCPSMWTCVRQRCQRLTRSGRLVPLIPAGRKKMRIPATRSYAVEMNFSQPFHQATRTKHLTGGPFCNLKPSYTRDSS
jgi:hypothetical protein